MIEIWWFMIFFIGFFVMFFFGDLYFFFVVIMGEFVGIGIEVVLKVWLKWIEWDFLLFYCIGCVKIFEKMVFDFGVIMWV